MRVWCSSSTAPFQGVGRGANPLTRSMNLRVGDKAPDFSLQDQNGTNHKLSDYSGKQVLLYFYPKDDTPGCTTEACEIRDNFDAFKKLNIIVLGVSADSVESHEKFAGKYDLPFTLLSDKDKTVINAYGVIKRTSFLIDKKGKIEKIYENVKPAEHAKEVIKDAN